MPQAQVVVSKHRSPPKETGDLGETAALSRALGVCVWGERKVSPELSSEGKKCSNDRDTPKGHSRREDSNWPNRG